MPLAVSPAVASPPAVSVGAVRPVRLCPPVAITSPPAVSVGAVRPVRLCTPVAITSSPAVSVASPTGTVAIATTTPTSQLRGHQRLTALGPDDLQGLRGGAFLLVV